MADSSKQNRIGDLLKMVRGKRDLSQAAFAARLQDLFGQRWTLDIVKHLEDGSTKFRQWHLDDLVSAGFMEDQGSGILVVSRRHGEAVVERENRYSSRSVG